MGKWKEVAESWRKAHYGILKQREEARCWSAAWKRAAKEYRTMYYGEYPVIAMIDRDIQEARQVARRLLRERDEARETIETQTATIQHLESDRDALAFRNAVLTDLCTTIETERMNMRKALEHIRENGVDIDCPKCGADIGWVPPDRYFKSLGLAK